MTDDADYLLYTAPQDCIDVPPPALPPGEVLHRVQRSGVTLLTVMRLEAAMEAALYPGVYNVREGDPPAQ